MKKIRIPRKLKKKLKGSGKYCYLPTKTIRIDVIKNKAFFGGQYVYCRYYKDLK